MIHRLCRCAIPALLLCLLAWPGAARAVIVQGGHDANGTSDSSGRNLNPAPANLSNFVGLFGNYLGTPIAPRYFITANHIGNGFLQQLPTGSFVYNNGTATPTTYTVTRVATQNDLAVWKIADTDPAFSLYAPMYAGNNEQGQSLVALGRGTQRGAVVNAPATGQPGGWQWGATDKLVSWGTGTFDPVTTVTTPGFGGDQLNWRFTFDAGKPDTGILSDGDSGGPVFVLNPANSQYELAGINGLVDQVSASSDPNGTATLAYALYDARGFYNGKDLITGDQAVPLSSYASRISSAESFINGALVPEPSTAAVLLVVGCGACLRRRKRV